MPSARKRMVFDTSSLLPACLHPDRGPAQIFKDALLAHDVFTSTAAYDELATVLMRSKFNAWQPMDYRLMWLRLYRDAVQWVSVSVHIDACRDPKDNKFLEAAVAAQADVLVSSDVHLLEMHPFQGIDILTLTDFQRMLATH